MRKILFGYMDVQILRLEALLIFRCCKAFAAVYRSVACGLERNLSLFATLSTGYCEVLSLGLSCVLSLVTTCLASLRLVLEALLCIKFLLACCEHELLATVFAN